MLEPEVTRNFSNIDPVYKFWYFDRHGFLCSFWLFKTLHWNVYFDYRVFWCLLRLYSSLAFPLFWSCLWGLWSRGLGAGAVIKCCSRETYIPDFQLYANAGEAPPGAPKIVWERTVGAAVGRESPPTDWREVPKGSVEIWRQHSRDLLRRPFSNIDLSKVP